MRERESRVTWSVRPTTSRNTGRGLPFDEVGHVTAELNLGIPGTYIARTESSHRR